MRISWVAYAVEEMASDAKTGSATFFGRRVWCSSEVAMGEPRTTRFSAAYICGTFAQRVAGLAAGPGIGPG